MRRATSRADLDAFLQRAAPRREQLVQDAIRDRLNLSGYVRKIHTSGIPNPDGVRRNPSAGVADLVGVYRAPCPLCGLELGRFVAVEVKRPRGGVVSPAQERYLASSRAAGGLALVARSVDELTKGLAGQLDEDRASGAVGRRRRQLDELLGRLDDLLAEALPSAPVLAHAVEVSGRIRRLFGVTP